jgi:hypothetical protein
MNVAHPECTVILNGLITVFDFVCLSGKKTRMRGVRSFHSMMFENGWRGFRNWNSEKFLDAFKRDY